MNEQFRIKWHVFWIGSLQLIEQFVLTYTFLLNIYLLGVDSNLIRKIIMGVIFGTYCWVVGTILHMRYFGSKEHNAGIINTIFRVAIASLLLLLLNDLVLWKKIFTSVLFLPALITHIRNGGITPMTNNFFSKFLFVMFLLPIIAFNLFTWIVGLFRKI